MPADASARATVPTHRRELSGWGRNPVSGSAVADPLSADEVAVLLETSGSRGVIARGLGRGYGDGAQNADTLGGWQMMVSTYSQNQPAAIAFAQYMTSREVQKSFAIEESRLPTIVDLYDDADVLEANPFFGKLKDVFLGGAVARPSTVTSDLYNEVSTAYFTAVNEILTGQATDAAARVAQLAEQLEGIVAEL